MQSLTKNTKTQLYNELQTRINEFNRHTNRKLTLFLTKDKHPTLSENQPNTQPQMRQNINSMQTNQRMVTQPMMQQQVFPPQVIQQPMVMQQAPVIMQQQRMTMQQSQQPVIMQQPIQQPMQPVMMQQAPVMMQQPMAPGTMQIPMVPQNGVMINGQQQPNAPNRRSLFIGGLLGAVSPGLGDAASSVTGALGANGGAGAGLLGAGAGLMMATMGKGEEQEERDNLGQELRSKEFKFMTKQGQKVAEFGIMDKEVSRVVCVNVLDSRF
jgi:hypothetical protein